MAAGDNSNKAELLKQLVGDGSSEDASELKVESGQGSGLRAWHLVVVALLAALAAGLAVIWLMPAQTTQAKPEGTASTLTSTQQTNPAQTSTADQSSAAQATSQSLAAEEALNGKRAPTSSAILNASGYITARRVATVSAEIMGLITEIAVDEGMQVAAQQVLARLDDRKAKVGLQLAEAQVQSQSQRLESFRTDLQEAERVLARLSQLREEHFSSEAQRTRAATDVEKLRASLAGAKAELEVARLNVAQAQEVLDDHTIRSPFAGVITVKNAQPGEIVAPTAAGGGNTRTGICTVVDMSSLEIEVDVNEAYIGRVTPGQKVIANLDAYPKWDIPASVIAIIPTANRAKATVQVRIKITQPDPRILPNMGVKVAFFDEQVSVQ